MMSRASGLVVCCLLSMAGGCHQPDARLSEAADDFCRDERRLLQTADAALKAGETESVLGELFSMAAAMRVSANFRFCVHTRSIPEKEWIALADRFNVAHDRYFQARIAALRRADFSAARQHMAAMISMYDELLSFPVR